MIVEKKNIFLKLFSALIVYFITIISNRWIRIIYFKINNLNQIHVTNPKLDGKHIK